MKRFLSNLSLRNKILIPIIALTAVCSLVLSWISYSQASKALKKNLLDGMIQTLEMTSRQMESWVRNRTIDMEGYAEQKVFRMAMEDNFVGKSAKVSANSDMERIAKRYGYYEAISLVDTNGMIIASSEPSYINKISVTNRHYFFDALAGKSVVSEVVQSNAKSNAVFVVAVPVKEKDKSLGIMMGIVDLGVFGREMVTPVKVLQSGYLAMVDRNGQMLVHPNPSLVMNYNISTSDWGAKILQTKSGTIEYAFQGVEKTATFMPVPALASTLIATVPLLELEGPARKIGWTSALFGIVTVVLASIVVLILARSIVNPVNSMIHNLTDTATQLGETAAQISNASQSLAEGASEQAASLEETSASLEEMASMTRRNADNAKGAKDTANQSREAAEEGAQTTRHMSQSMAQIQEAGQAMRGAMNDVKEANNEVSKIIKTIDEIAFQTNILALNAAVEAARAGEAGLGFAVVADEVRNLAQKSAVSARDTANRIQSAIERSERGTKISEQMAENLQSVANQAKLMESNLTDMVGKVQQVDQMVAEIATASVEQNQGIEQVNRAVSEMDKVTQSNAANAEESSSASVELKRQAEQLRQAIGALETLVRGGSAESGNKTVAVQSPPEVPAEPKGPVMARTIVRATPQSMSADFLDFRR